MRPIDTTTGMTVACPKLGCIKKFSTHQDLVSHYEEDHSRLELDLQSIEKTILDESVSEKGRTTAGLASDIAEKHDPIESLEVKPPTSEGGNPNLNYGELCSEVSVSNPRAPELRKNQSPTSSLGKPAERTKEEHEKQSFAVKYPTCHYNRLPKGNDPRYLESCLKGLSVDTLLEHSSFSDEGSDDGEANYVLDSKRY